MRKLEVPCVFLVVRRRKKALDRFFADELYARDSIRDPRVSISVAHLPFLNGQPFGAGLGSCDLGN